MREPDPSRRVLRIAVSAELLPDMLRARPLFHQFLGDTWIAYTTTASIPDDLEVIAAEWNRFAHSPVSTRRALWRAKVSPKRRVFRRAI